LKKSNSAIIVGMEKNLILVVDDDNEIREIMKRGLSSQGFDVITANNGKEGLAIAIDKKPKLVVTDVQMPEMDGMEMLKELRISGEWGKNIPVIILTNFDASDETMDSIIKTEPSFYLLKSNIDPELLAEKIKETLRQ